MNVKQRSCLVSARLPDLRMVIMTDSRQPGMLHLDDVMQAGESQHHRDLMALQSKLSADDPINIQFTSVTFSTAPYLHMHCFSLPQKGTHHLQHRKHYEESLVNNMLHL